MLGILGRCIIFHKCNRIIYNIPVKNIKIASQKWLIGSADFLRMAMTKKTRLGRRVKSDFLGGVEKVKSLSALLKSSIKNELL